MGIIDKFIITFLQMYYYFSQSEKKLFKEI